MNLDISLQNLKSMFLETYWLLHHEHTFKDLRQFQQIVYNFSTFTSSVKNTLLEVAKKVYINHREWYCCVVH